MSAIRMGRTQRILVGLVVAGAVVIAGIGFAGSYAAVRTLALHKGFGWFANVFPVGVDAGIVVLLSLDLLLTWLRIPFPLLRQTAWLLTAATIAFNGAAAWPDPLGVGMHAVIPVLFVVSVEAARHAVGRIADITADRHMESVRVARWLLAFPSTFRLWRRMKLWELRSYDQVIRLEQDRLVYQARLRARFGRNWRRRAPVESLMPLRLAKFGVPLSETSAAGLLAAGIVPEAAVPVTSAGTAPRQLAPATAQSPQETPAPQATQAAQAAQETPAAQDGAPEQTPAAGAAQSPASRSAAEGAPAAVAPYGPPAFTSQGAGAQVYVPPVEVSYLPQDRRPDPSQPIPWPPPEAERTGEWPAPVLPATPETPAASPAGPQDAAQPPWFTQQVEEPDQETPSPWPTPVVAAQPADRPIPAQQNRRRLAERPEPPAEPESPRVPDGVDLEEALVGAFNSYTQRNGEPPTATQFGFYLADGYSILNSAGQPLSEQYLRPRLHDLVEARRVEETG